MRIQTFTIDQFRFIKIHTWPAKLGVVKQKKSSFSVATNNTFLLFYSLKPRNQVRILINRKWSSGFVNHGEQKRLE